MNRVIYEESIRPRDLSRDLSYAPRVMVTEEANGYAVFVDVDCSGTKLLYYEVSRSQSSRVLAIRKAISFIDDQRQEGGL